MRDVKNSKSMQMAVEQDNIYINRNR